MTREEARIYWTGRYEAAKKWDDPHWEASERKEHRRYVDALNAAIKALSAEAVQEAVPTVVRVTMSDGNQYYLEHERVECDHCVYKWGMKGGAE